MDGIVTGREVQDAVVDADTVLAGQCLFGSIDFEGAAGHFEVVLRDDAVAVVTGDGQFAGAVDRQGRFRPDGGVDVVAGVGIRGSEGRARRDLVGRTVLQGDKDLVACLHVNGGAGVVGDGHVVEDQLDLVLIADVDDDLSVVGAGQDVRAGFGDRHFGRRLFREVDGGRILIGRIEVPVGEQIGVGGLWSALLRHFGLCALSALRVRGRLRAAGGEDQDHGQRHQDGGQFMGHRFHQSVSPSPAPRTIMLISRLPLRTRRSSIRAFSVPASFSRIL